MISTEDKYTDTRIIQHNVCSLQYLTFWRVFEIAAHTLDPLGGGIHETKWRNS